MFHTQRTVLTTVELLTKSHTYDTSASLLVAIRKLKLFSHVPIFCAVLKISLQDVYVQNLLAYKFQDPSVSCADTRGRAV